MLIALQARTDSTLRIRTFQVAGGRGGGEDAKASPSKPASPCPISPPAMAWPTTRPSAKCATPTPGQLGRLIGGSIFTLLKEESIPLPTASPCCSVGRAHERRHRILRRRRNRHPLLPQRLHRASKLDAGRLARLAQMAENHVVGAPLRHHGPDRHHLRTQGQITHILCRRARSWAKSEIPPGTGFVGINSMVRHSSPATLLRRAHRAPSPAKRHHQRPAAKTARAPVSYLTEIPPTSCAANIFTPAEAIIGSQFLATYKTHDDPVTTIQPDASYRVAGPPATPSRKRTRAQVYGIAARRLCGHQRAW